MTSLKEKLNGWPAAQRRIFYFAAAMVFIWLFLIFVVLRKPQADFLSEFQFDKIAHFSAGILIASLLGLLYNVNGRKKVIYIALSLGILWEICEVFFLPDQMRRFRQQFFWWFSDSVFDVISGVLGAYFWANMRRMSEGKLKSEAE